MGQTELSSRNKVVHFFPVCTNICIINFYSTLYIIESESLVLVISLDKKNARSIAYRHVRFSTTLDPVTAYKVACSSTGCRLHVMAATCACDDVESRQLRHFSEAPDKKRKNAMGQPFSERV